MTIIAASVYGADTGLVVVADTLSRRVYDHSENYACKIKVIGDVIIASSGVRTVREQVERALESKENNVGLNVYTAVQTVVDILNNDVEVDSSGLKLVCGLIDGHSHMYAIVHEAEKYEYQLYVQKVFSINSKPLSFTEDRGVYNHPDFFSELLEEHAFPLRDITWSSSLRFDRGSYQQVWSQCVRKVLRVMETLSGCGGSVSHIHCTVGVPLRVNDGPVTQAMLATLP